MDVVDSARAEGRLSIGMWQHQQQYSTDMLQGLVIQVYRVYKADGAVGIQGVDHGLVLYPACAKPANGAGDGMFPQCTAAWHINSSADQWVRLPELGATLSVCGGSMYALGCAAVVVVLPPHRDLHPSCVWCSCAAWALRICVISQPLQWI
jgi:hypothetical protein